MGKLIISTQITLDGVMEPFGGWFNVRGEHSWDVAAGRASFDQLRAADAILLGRKTFDGLAAAWPAITDEVGFADHINAKQKFVASRSPQDALTWNAAPLTGDLPTAVAALKTQADGHLVSYGCGELAHELAARGLVDEFRFWINPVIWGHGVRPFDGYDPVRLTLLSTTTYDTGIVRLNYRPADAPS
jgi:dihydrofolate reductase